MSEHFAFLGDKRKAAITAAMSSSALLLLLLPASLGYGGRTIVIVQEAFGQFNLPLLDEEEEDSTTTPTPPPTTTPSTPTTPPAATTSYTNNIQDPSIFLLRGLIGSYLPPQGSIGGAGNDDSGHVVTGRFRVFANESLVRRVVAEMNVAALDGSSFHNITITEGAPHRFQVVAGDNGTTTTTTASASSASIPVVSSNIVGTIYLDGGATPVIDNVPMTLTVRGQTLALQRIDIDETRIADTGQRDAISSIDGQSIYGVFP